MGALDEAQHPAVQAEHVAAGIGREHGPELAEALVYGILQLQQKIRRTQTIARA